MDVRAAFMHHVARQLTQADKGLLGPAHVLICDRDSKWSSDVPVCCGMQESGWSSRRSAPLNANAYAGRFVRSIKEECLDRLIPIGEAHFRRAVAEFVEHYHRERNHQGLGNALIAGSPATDGQLTRPAACAGTSGWADFATTTNGPRDL
jgi:putative transposase